MMVRKLINYLGHRDYYITFTLEVPMDPDYKDYIIGRLEIYKKGFMFPVEEKRVFTKDVKGFFKDLDKIEFKDISGKKLLKIVERFKKYNEMEK